MTDIEQAIARKETQLHYQPIVSLTTGHLIGFEALLRWLHPEYGLLFPAVFMPQPDQQDALINLTRWGLSQVCADLRYWQEAAPRQSCIVSVNISNPFLQDDTRLKELSTQVRGLESSFAAEISEPEAIADVEAFARPLKVLSGAGIRLYLDNFGTQFSSVGVLADMPLAAVKLDRTLVARLPDDEKAVKLARALVTLALSLDRDVIATGVETEDQARMMAASDCQFAQGFFFCAPLEAHDALSLLQRGKLGGDVEDQQVASRLRNYDLFAGLTGEELDEISRGCHVRSVPSGTVVIRQGQVGNEFYLLEEGSVKVYRESKGTRQDLAEIHAPAIFGEMAVINPERTRTASVQAISDLHMLAIPVDVFLYYLRRWPALRERLRSLVKARTAGR